MGKGKGWKSERGYGLGGNGREPSLQCPAWPLRILYLPLYLIRVYLCKFYCMCEVLNFWNNFRLQWTVYLLTFCSETCWSAVLFHFLRCLSRLSRNVFCSDSHVMCLLLAFWNVTCLSCLFNTIHFAFTVECLWLTEKVFFLWLRCWICS